MRVDGSKGFLARTSALAVCSAAVIAMAGSSVATAETVSTTGAPTIQHSNAAFANIHSGAPTTFANPIMDNGADPWMTYHNGYYYMTMTTGDNVTIWKSKSMSDIADGAKTVIWTPKGTNFNDIWAPELHFINGRWYVYFAADENGKNPTHRMYVLESQSADAMSSYTFKGEITSPSNQWAIDGTVLPLNNHLYFIWSGWINASNTRTQNLYIAPMSSPTKISGHRVLISSPTLSWENSVAPINEGPEILQHDGKTFLIYSANASWTNQYALGMLTLTGPNPLLASNWVKHQTPVFQSGNGVYGPGHASFTTSPDGTQDYIVYHAARYSGAGWNRTVRTQPFTWNADGSPNFGTLISTNAELPLPSGEKPDVTQYQRSSKDNTGPTYTVRIDHAGWYNLSARYANGTSGAVLANVSVNGRAQNTVSYDRTGGPSDWSTVWDEIYLPHGTDVIHFDSGNGDVSFGWLDVPFHGSTASHGPITTYQAENNIYSDARIVGEYNAENGEVVGWINNPDSYVNFNNVYARKTGTYTITVRYDNGLGDGTDEVSVNGGTAFSLSLPRTGAWNTFKTVTFNTPLTQGENSIVLSHGSNYAQIDDIVVSPAN